MNNEKKALLFQPLELKTVTLKNKIVLSPMCQYSSEDGFANDWHLVHIGSRAVGGTGLLMMEATAVSPEGRITPADLGIWKKEHLPYLQRITRFVKQQGALPGIQLAHAGRKASHRSPWEGGTPLHPSEGAWTTFGPSAIPFADGTPAPKELDTEGIRKVKSDFRQAAQFALEAGFQVVEIHAAHGYLLHSFCSPLSNKRADEYGGPFDNRIRLLLEVVSAVQEVWPHELPLFVRISATDWTEGGWTVEDSVALAKKLKEAGIDLIDCSTGGNVPSAPIPAGPLYQVPFAEQIKKEAGIKTGAVGVIFTPEQAEEILARGQADLIFMGRELLRNPYFPLQAAKAMGVEVPWPVQYLRAKR